MAKKEETQEVVADTKIEWKVGASKNSLLASSDQGHEVYITNARGGGVSIKGKKARIIMNLSVPRKAVRQGPIKHEKSDGTAIKMDNKSRAQHLKEKTKSYDKNHARQSAELRESVYNECKNILIAAEFDVSWLSAELLSQIQ